MGKYFSIYFPIFYYINKIFIVNNVNKTVKTYDKKSLFIGAFT